MFGPLFKSDRQLSLGKRIGKGGEGEVYALSDSPSEAIKLYTLTDIKSRIDKVSAMIAGDLASTSKLVSFPSSLVFDSNRKPVGFSMRLVQNHKPLHELYSPGPRKQNFPQADYRFLVRTAANVARAVGAVHRCNCVIGDINHSGILVSDEATVALIDADSFQYTEGNTSHLCRVGVPEYTPPELQGLKLDSTVRTPNHDRFGLAVVLFQLLFMGRHPFVGRVRFGEMPATQDNIKLLRYAYSETRDVGLDQPPGTPSISDFGSYISELFETAFSSKGISARPSPEEWVQALQKLEGSLERCQDNSLHYISREASDCAWCEMEAALTTILFLPVYTNAGGAILGSDPGATSFDLEAIWTAIDSVKFPSDEELRPDFPRLQLQPSPKARQLKEGKSSSIYWIGLVALIGGFVALPAYWILWIPAIIVCFQKARSKQLIDTDQFKTAYLQAHNRLGDGVWEWWGRVGLTAAYTQKQELAKAYLSYKALKQEESKLLRQYQQQRRETQLNQFLSRFSVATAPIDKIGRAQKTTLASFGIDTAADITSARLEGVPGIGKVRKKALFDWRAGFESRFVYVALENDLDRQFLNQNRIQAEQKGRELRQKLMGGKLSLERTVARLKENLRKGDGALEQIFEVIAQNEVDLGFLGATCPSAPPLPKPPVFKMPTAESISTTTSQHAQASAVTKTPTNPNYRPPSTNNPKSAPNCPRCSRSMVMRTARRGRNAGRPFWGCSRYPVCKGTRNV